MSTKALERHLQPLQQFLQTDGVTEVCINAPQVVFVEQQQQFTRYDVPELEFGFLETLAQLVAEFNSQTFPHPLVAGSLPNGERCQFVLPPACSSDTLALSIRRHQLKDFSLADYEKAGAFAALTPKGSRENTADEQLKIAYQKGDIQAFLQLAILAKKNILISGGTGTGKTTFLNACLKLIPPGERLITVEDSPEVVVQQPNWVRLLFNEDDPRITAAKLFKTCLRLRPDRIFLSELRGIEAWPFLRAANSGHPGSLSTVHADTPQGCFDQLVFMMQQAGSTTSEERLRSYLHSIIPIVIQLKRATDGRRFMEVSEVYYDALA